MLTKRNRLQGRTDSMDFQQVAHSVRKQSLPDDVLLFLRKLFLNIALETAQQEWA